MLLTVVLAAGGCAGKTQAPFGATAGALVPRPAPERVALPALVLGRFADDYGSVHTINSDEWRHDAHSKYHIVKWVGAKEYLIAYNDIANPSDGGKWTRIDWLPLPGMPPYEWAFCLSAYKAATAAEAEATTTANRALPRTGCSGFPFTRMNRVGAAPDAP